MRNMKLLYLLLTVLITLPPGKSAPSTNIDQTSDPTLSDFKGCGYRNIDGIGFRISDNNEDQANFGEFPWMVALFKEEHQLNKKANIYQCGGALITPSVILTAAHCVLNKPASTLKVRAGEWDPQNQKEILSDQDRNVVDVVMHADYDDDILNNDIALVFVSLPFELDAHIQPVCLPPSNMTFDNTRCFVTGWGKDVQRQFQPYERKLKKIEIPIVPKQRCEKALSKESCRTVLHETFICAGGEIGKDVCDGDGGSPLVCPIAHTTDRYYQAGIVSWGMDNNCGTEMPGVYANVSNLRTWIDDVLSKKQMVQSSYFTPPN